MKRLILTVLLMWSASAALADTVNQGFVGCITEDALSEFISAAVKNDTRQMQALIGSTCVPIGGLEYSMVDQGFITSEIRVYVGSDSLRVFTPAEATR